MVRLFSLRFYVPVNNFSVMSGRFYGLNQYLAMNMTCLAQAHNSAPLVRFASATLRSRVRNSTNKDNCAPIYKMSTSAKWPFQIGSCSIQSRHSFNKNVTFIMAVVMTIHASHPVFSTEQERYDKKNIHHLYTPLLYSKTGVNRGIYFFLNFARKHISG